MQTCAFALTVFDFARCETLAALRLTCLKLFDLELASAIQARLLPSRHLHIHGWDVVYHYEPVGPVSGDYCDVIPRESRPGEGYVLLGDVSGKGVSASLLMSHLNATFRTLAQTELPVDELVERANRLFSVSVLTTHFATLVCSRLSADGDVDVCNAGHCAPLLVGRGVVTELPSTGTPVGMFDRTGAKTQTVHLAEGDSLLLYTDGVTETQNRSGEEYGTGHLQTVLSSSHRLQGESLLQSVVNDLRTFRDGFERSDDVTLLSIKRTV